MTTVAVMQPYFVPYAGYFRLFAAADVVAFFDCVQFPRRGWVHRNRLRDAAGHPRWLTLPLAKAPRESEIRAMMFAPDAADRFEAELRRFMPDSLPAAAARLQIPLRRVGGQLVDYLEASMRATCAELALPFVTVRSSTLGLDPGLRGADRVIAVARRLGADVYLNLPGGRALYDETSFSRAGLGLRFLPIWSGSSLSILQRLIDEEPATIRREILAQLGESWLGETASGGARAGAAQSLSHH
jgi:hypothetical protein